MITKAIKWSRRWAVSLLTDYRWRDPRVHPTWVGSPSGGALVDLGLMPANAVVYSFGIACEISFDREIIQKTGCRVYGFDPDPRSEAWLQRPEIWVPNEFTFHLMGLANRSSRQSFFITDMEKMTGSLQQGSKQQSITAEFKTLADIMCELGHTWVDVMKLDIEGAEYEVLESWLQDGHPLPVGQLWIEYHPDGVHQTVKSSEVLLRRLSDVGMVPGCRNYFRNPNNVLMVNRRILDKRSG